MQSNNNRKMKRKIAIPRMGFYTEIFEDLLRDCGAEVIPTKQINQTIIKKGVKYSSDMMCFPFKVVMGCFIDGLERGADTLMMWGAQNTKCRIGQYYNIAEQLLRDSGYEFEMINIHGSPIGVMGSLSKIGDKNVFQVMGAVKKHWKVILEEEKKNFPFYENADIKIGITGEIYTLLEPYINYDIIKKLQNMGVAVDVSTKLSHFLTHRINIKSKLHEKKELKPYIQGDIGGHGNYSLYSTIQYAKKGYDGVVHLLPLSCMPETTVEMLMDRVGRQYDIPIYRFPIDENRFEAGFDTRIETFISILRRRKKCISE
jgi:predicted nucleotide-binding protein (sugar kinase/HSP70/actin superfamily)